MQRLYELAWGTYDSYQYFLFSHDQEKSKEEFQSDCNTLLRKYGEEYIIQEPGNVGAQRWVEFVAEKLPELGYARVKPLKAEYDGCMLIPYMDEDRLGEDDLRWKEIVGEDLYEKGRQHNRALAKSHGCPVSYEEADEYSLKSLKKKFRPLAIHFPIFKNAGFELTFFNPYRSFRDGITLLDGKINLDYFRSDHNPKFELWLDFLNVRIVEMSVYNIHHME